MMDPRNISIDLYDYPLPDERIARYPLAVRDACKLLRRDAQGRLSEHVFSELPALLPADTLLVCNNTRVINARIRMHKPSGAQVEIFCLEPATGDDYNTSFGRRGSCRWQCLVGNSKRWKGGAVTTDITVGGRTVRLDATRMPLDASAAWDVEFTWDDPSLTFAEIIGAAGEIPIPPYLGRESEESDATDYQTVYSRIDGSVAAPTAGLHFTDRVLADIAARGIDRLEVTLHVGAGTFRPVKTDNIGGHDMHSEYIAVDIDVLRRIAAHAGPIYAVGTTSVRTLESLYHAGCLMAQGRWQGEVPQWYPYDDSHPDLTVADAIARIIDMLVAKGLRSFVASTRIIIAPGYRYRIVRGMVTNFHQPRSTLLLLVGAMTGDGWRQMYDYALARDFRFLSYGDACLIESND